MANTEEEENSSFLEEKEEVILKTHTRINQELSGELIFLDHGYAEIEIRTTPDMLADDQGLIHGGFIFSAADYAAMAAVNEKNVVLVASDCQFLSPVKQGDMVKIKAKLRHKEGRKRNVLVTGHVHDIKVFEGIFKTVILDKHVLKLKLLEDEDQEKLGTKKAKDS